MKILAGLGLAMVASVAASPVGAAQQDTQAPVLVRPGVYKMGPGITPPRSVLWVVPSYPEDAERAGVRGSVSLRAVILADGTVGDVSVVPWPGSLAGFDQAAIAAVRESQYSPATLNGTPVAVEIFTLVTFERPDRDLGLWTRQRVCDPAAYMDTVRPDAEGALAPVLTRRVQPATSWAARRRGRECPARC